MIDEAAAEQAGEMHRRLAVADHRDVDQRARLLDRRVLHRAEREDVVAFGFSARKALSRMICACSDARYG